jgi:hypothetical protein
VSRAGERARLAAAIREKAGRRNNRYRARLESMLETAGVRIASPDMKAAVQWSI